MMEMKIVVEKEKVFKEIVDGDHGGKSKGDGKIGDTGGLRDDVGSVQDEIHGDEDGDG